MSVQSSSTSMSKSKGVVRVGWDYHSSQSLVRRSGARFKVLLCGRRWRKTGLMWMELYRRAMERVGIYWWVAPRYKELAGVRQVIKETTPDVCFKKITEVSMAGNVVLRYCMLPNGSEVFFHSADTEDSMRGIGLCGLVIDEADLIERSRWDNELRPSLADKIGWAMFGGTPKGHRMLYEFLLRGRKHPEVVGWVDEWPDWESWNFSSYDNPFLDRREIDDMKKSLPDMVFRQEIMAECLDDVGQVFRNIQGSVDKSLALGRRDGERYAIGEDLAKTEDFQVHVALDYDGNLRGIERFHELDWGLQKKRMTSFGRVFNESRILIDSTGLGDPIYDELRREYPFLDGYKISGLGPKADLIENLSIMLDQGKIRFPDPDKCGTPNVRILLDELASFGYELGETGTLRYHAPEGLHDDCVIALALAAWQIGRSPTGPIRVSSGKRAK